MSLTLFDFQDFGDFGDGIWWEKFRHDDMPAVPAESHGPISFSL